MKKKSCLILPIGVTVETVEGLIRNSSTDNISCIVAVLIKDKEHALIEKKRHITDIVRALAQFLGAEYEELWVSLNDDKISARLYRLLIKHKPEQVIISCITGSRFVILHIILAVLWYRKTELCQKIWVIHGIEGDKWRIEPLQGYLVDKLTPAQRRIFRLIYQHPRNKLRTKEDLIEKYGLGRSVYKILGQLRDKGLIEWKRNQIEKTYPGKLLFNLLETLAENEKKIDSRGAMK